MADNINNAIDRLKNMLSTEAGQKELEGILSSVSKEDNTAIPSGLPSNAFNAEGFLKIKSLMDKLQINDDPRVRLLTSLRPYISKNRERHLDSAIKIMTLGKLPYLLAGKLYDDN